ncbi:MAG TPA: branched-chain amino acid aminotransferase [Planctomycetales bacterium]|jgi:branched-chain amino acid aminotransferase|nr:branched-chain amino acid aminotransferase [Planctomycetales bacterium]
MTKVYINGKFFDKADARISVYDHGLLYGDGVFEGIRIYGSRIFRLHEHIERLYESAKHIALEIPLTREQIMEAVRGTVQINDKKDGYIRLVVTRGAGGLGLDPRKTTDPQIIIIVDDISMYPRELYENGLEVITSSYIRPPSNALNPRIKSLNYLNNILAKIEAIRAGCLEAIMLNGNGEVAECTGDNIFLVKRGVLKTPPAHAGILEGITRGVIMELAVAAQVPLQETTLTRHDVYTADECFLTGTGAEIIPVVMCDGRVIGTGKPGPITRQLRERFQEAVRQD